MSIGLQVAYLFLLAITVACISWTCTHEEVLREPRDFCKKQSMEARSLVTRKFFYLFTCEYCFSHYVTIGILALTKFHLIYEDWRGYLIAGLSLVWIANIYMGLYSMIKLDIKSERLDINKKEAEKNS